MKPKRSTQATKGMVVKGEYFDSVSLMNIAREIQQWPGVIDSAVMMGTPQNRSLLQTAGYDCEQFRDAGDSDLLVSVRSETGSAAERILEKVAAFLKENRKSKKSGKNLHPGSLEGALGDLPQANLALISIPGFYAAGEAFKALEKGLHVFLFSDNVPLEKEIELKRYAAEHHLLVMGPDCGSAIINGVPIGFANRVKRGEIGIISASGTGLQEVTCLISRLGAGISQAIGTGGRDLKKEVGGVMFIGALKALGDDSRSRVVLLVSKPPDDAILRQIAAAAKKVKKPVVAVFLGANGKVLKSLGLLPAPTLEGGALLAASLALGKSLTDLSDPVAVAAADWRRLAEEVRKSLLPRQKYLRGLFSGGTFAYEAQILLKDLAGEIYSNVPLGSVKKLSDSATSQKHTIVDLGEDEFTRGRPHPMIDFSLRNQRLIKEVEDPKTAVILLDLVLGYGANPAPLTDLVPVLNRIRETCQSAGKMIPILASVTGTDDDPQNRSQVVTGLRRSGVTVLESNAAACRLAGSLIESCRGNPA